MLNYLYTILLIAYAGMILGFILRRKILVGLMGMVLIFAGLAMVTDGLGGELNQLTEVFGIITTVIGTIFFLEYVMEEIENIEI